MKIRQNMSNMAFLESLDSPGIKIGNKFPRLLRHNGNRSKAPYSSSPNNSNSSSNLLALSNSGRRTLVLLGSRLIKTTNWV